MHWGKWLMVLKAKGFQSKGSSWPRSCLASLRVEENNILAHLKLIRGIQLMSATIKLFIIV